MLEDILEYLEDKDGEYIEDKDSYSQISVYMFRFNYHYNTHLAWVVS